MKGIRTDRQWCKERKKKTCQNWFSSLRISAYKPLLVVTHTHPSPEFGSVLDGCWLEKCEKIITGAVRRFANCGKVIGGGLAEYRHRNWKISEKLEVKEEGEGGNWQLALLGWHYKGGGRKHHLVQMDQIFLEITIRSLIRSIFLLVWRKEKSAAGELMGVLRWTS